MFYKRRRVDGWRALPAPALAAAGLFLCCFSPLAAFGDPAAGADATPANSVELTDYLFFHEGYGTAIVSLLDKDTLITAHYGFDARSTIDFWDLKTGKVTAQIVTPTPIQPRSVQVSPDGLQLLAVQSVAYDSTPIVTTYHTVYIWDIKTRQLIRAIDRGDARQIEGAFFIPGDPDHILITDSEAEAAVQGAQAARFDLRTGKADRVVPYKDAWRIVSGWVVFSPDAASLATINPPGGDTPQAPDTPTGEDNPPGEDRPPQSHPPVVEKPQAPFGSFDLLNLKTFAAITHYAGPDVQHLVNLPAFFVDPKRLALGNTLYDLTTGRTSPVMPVTPARRFVCLAPIPGRPGYALYVMKEGDAEPVFALWNVASQTVVQRWPVPRHPHLVRSGKKPVQVSGTDPDHIASAFISGDGEAFGCLSETGAFRVYLFNFKALPDAATRPDK